MIIYVILIILRNKSIKLFKNKNINKRKNKLT